ncbi:Bicupin, oxalate decarboxylase/oxidase [Parasponia andersonii]|uniref:Bicupin, oxalate decarboxylase/oxidase n=1 Tax=Parasponia andersonii TaxID=3476 RepID=A0A2P5C2I1_PARAD|nr:Bicupin, oxalate decarboxylase/oxidase [Parasponia andersonii]
MAALKLSLLVLLLLSVVVLSSSVVWGKQDPELKQCQHQCRHQKGFDEEQKSQCERRCEDYIREKKERERRERERERGGGGGEEESYYGTREREEGERVTERGPYVFEEEHFETRVRTEEGRVHILRKFTEKSKLLKGIENFRVGFLEANPNAFVAPVHFDADTVFFVASGKPTVTLLREDKKDTFNLEFGDILNIPAGTPVYMVNRDEREKLFIIKLINPVSLPGHFEPFYGPGGENPETFYKAFSWEVLSAAFKRDRDEIERLFRQQKRGSIVKASRQQVQELSRHAEGGRGGGGTIWPFGGDTGGPFNLFRNRRPTHSNRFGSLFEADPSEYKQLEHLNLMISFANITKGAMTAPAYNSRATKISFVVDGEGFFEMACPHVSSEQGGGGRSRHSFERVTGRLRRGVVFVVPAGHPLTAITSGNTNLQILCFEVNAKGNVKYPLAGRKNIVNDMENVAKELSFSVPAREVDRIFRSQNEEFFFPGPTQQEQGGHRAYI